ncbi:MAG: hypothetical protein R3Y24_11210 [Eubacteriales bacterium]
MEKKTTECYVASLDLLGSSYTILHDKNDEHLNHVYNIYNSWKKIKSSGFYFKNLQIKFFSDNVVIAIDTSYGQSGLEFLIEFVTYITEHFLNCGYLIRGGISKGQIYMDDLMVWGSGLVNAYILESKKALYPRIIIAKEVVNEISQRTCDIMVLLDEDKQYYLSYLRGYGKNAKSYLQIIQKSLKMVDEQSKTCDDDVKLKLNWFKKYLQREQSHWTERERMKKAWL